MKVVHNDKLLTSIRRSFSRVAIKLRDHGHVSTRLYDFKQEDHSKFVNRYNWVFSVIVKDTSEKYFITQRFLFRQNEWTLYKEDQQ